MRRIPALAALVIAGIFTFGAAAGVSSAADNTAPPKTKFDHKTLGADAKDCKKCHKVNPPQKSRPASTPATTPKK